MSIRSWWITPRSDEADPPAAVTLTSLTTMVGQGT
jgi:hypothetical protein